MRAAEYLPEFNSGGRNSRKPDPARHCRYCGARMKRRRWPNNGAPSLESMTAFLHRVFCSRTCQGADLAARNRRCK